MYGFYSHNFDQFHGRLVNFVDVFCTHYFPS